MMGWMYWPARAVALLGLAGLLAMPVTALAAPAGTTADDPAPGQVVTIIVPAEKPAPPPKKRKPAPPAVPPPAPPAAPPQPAPRVKTVTPRKITPARPRARTPPPRPRGGPSAPVAVPLAPRGGASTLVLAPSSSPAAPSASSSGLMSRIGDAPSWLLFVGGGLTLVESLVLLGYAWRRLSERRSRSRRRLVRRL